jgi:hypothetical protein
VISIDLNTAIHREILEKDRAGYSEQVVKIFSKILATGFEHSFSCNNLLHKIRVVEVFPDTEIVSTSSRKLVWSHFLKIIYVQANSLGAEFG